MACLGEGLRKGGSLLGQYTRSSEEKGSFLLSFLEAGNTGSKNAVKVETPACFFRLFCQVLCMFLTTENNNTESFCLLRSKLLLKATKDSVAFFYTGSNLGLSS